MADPRASYVPLVDVVRGDVVESVHFGALVVVEASGRIESSLGDPEIVTYLRSAAKPFQLMPLLEHGAADECDLALVSWPSWWRRTTAKRCTPR